MLWTLNKLLFSIRMSIIREVFTRSLFNHGFVENTLAVVILAHKNLWIYTSQRSQTMERTNLRGHVLHNRISQMPLTVKRVKLSKSHDLSIPSPKSYQWRPTWYLFSSNRIKINWRSGVAKHGDYTPPCSPLIKTPTRTNSSTVTQHTGSERTGQTTGI